MPFIENEVKQVGPGVWLRVAVDNIAWAELGTAGVIIDALEDPTQADVVRDLLKSTSGHKVDYVVNTHWDLDHIACNPQWKQEGARILAHESCAQQAGDWAGRPDITFGKDTPFSDTAILRGFGDKRIELTYVGGTHTPWDTVLWFPHAKVLHIADLFGWGLIPCKPTKSKCALLSEILHFLIGFEADAVICGHGPDLEIHHLRRFRDYFEWMMEIVPPLAAEGYDVDAILDQVPPPGDMEDWWRFYAWKHKKNIELISQFAVED